MTPGVQITVRVAMPSVAAPTDTSVAFAVGQASSGPVGPRLITSLDDFTRIYGARNASAPYLYDFIDNNIKEGLSSAYVSRSVASGAGTASVILKDTGTVNVLTVKANGPGTWGNGLSVAVIAGIAAGAKVLVVTQGGVELERSLDVQSAIDAMNWINLHSQYLTATTLGTPTNQLATAAAAALTGGTDVTPGDTEHVAAIARFTPDLGPGQIAAPGVTSSTTQLALLAHAHANGRFALIDLADSASSSTLVAAAAALAGADAPYGAAYAGWHYITGVTQQSPRVVPSSCVMAGIIARNDPIYGQGQSPMGQWGQSLTSQGLTNRFTLQSDFDTLAGGQVNAFRQMLGGVRAYDLQTLANPSSQSQVTQIGAVRVLMALQAGYAAAGEQFAGVLVDGNQHKMTEFATVLAGVAKPYFDTGQLYGATFAEAVAINVGPAINPPDALAAGRLRAVVGVRVSPNTPRVLIEIVKAPITDTLGVAA